MIRMSSKTKLSGNLSMQKNPNNPESNNIDSSKLSCLIRESNPFLSGLDSDVKVWRRKNLYNNIKSIIKVVGVKTFIKVTHIPVMTAYGALYLDVIKKDGTKIHYGLAGTKVVTTVGVGYIVDAFQNSVELEDMKFHGIGTGGTAENVSDTDIETELTTEYQTNNTRATGTTAEGASTNIYQTVATNTVDATAAIVEHGVLSNATVGSGVLLDRTVFTVINLGSGDSLQSTYELTLTAGS